MKFDFLFNSPPYLVPLCLLLGALYAFLLYRKDSHFSKTLQWLLAALRFVAASAICLLLLNMLLRQINQTFQKKTVVIALDNSQSMNNAGAKTLATLRENLSQLQEKLKEKDYEIALQTLDEDKPNPEVSSILFNQKTTNLSSLLNSLKTNYEGQNIADVVLISDGINNQGLSPASEKFSFPIHTVGLGDTIPKKDVLVKAIFANKIAYLGNKFPVQADISSYGFLGKTVNVLLRNGNQVLDKKTITFKQTDDLQTVEFLTTATQKGVQRFTIVVEPISGEFSTKNNQQEVYVEVIDGKEKILLLALSPHPDIKALRSIIEKNDNYELDIRILTQNQSPDFTGKNYDLIILHQIPDFYNNGPVFIKRFLDAGVPCFFILGNQSGTNQLNNLNSGIQINGFPGQIDKVTGVFNSNFKLLNFDETKLTILKDLPQISVPFGDYKLQPNSEVILYQKVGNLVTQKPLFVVNTGVKKSATFLGEGLWQWRLQEYANTEKQEVIDDLILKVIQYVSSKDDKRKLRVYPTSSTFNIEEKVVFETEIYNGIYEKLYNIPVKLTLTDEKNLARNYTYTTSAENPRFEISNLPQGVYRYKALATVLGKEEEAKGEFIVKDIQLEAQNTTADFDLLRQVAKQSGGKFFKMPQWEQLLQSILSHQVPDKVESTEDLKEVINLRWLFFLILALLTVEWVLRKYFGGY